jgi:hypothetical protein
MKFEKLNGNVDSEYAPFYSLTNEVGVLAFKNLFWRRGIAIKLETIDFEI